MKNYFLILLIFFAFSGYSTEHKNYLNSIGELCEKSNGCKIERVPKNMPINTQNRSMLVLNEKYEYLDGSCLDNLRCKIIIKALKERTY